MKENNHITDDLLAKCLIGEATEAEQDAVNIWVQESSENKRYYNNLKLIWDSSKKLEAKSTVDTDAAWQRFQQRVQYEENGHTAKTIAIPRQIAWTRAAAVLVLIALGSWMTYQLGGFGGPDMIALESGNAVLTDTLPDGSVVTLNKQSKLSYPEDFEGNTRKLMLEGEAFFEVMPDKNKPFVIDANGVAVRVVGTSFNVKSRNDSTEVIVATGTVEVSKKEHEVRLQRNEKALFAKDKEPVKQNYTDELYNYYKTKEFVCNSTPLWRLVDVLNEAYGTDIVIANDRLKYMELTTIFKNESLDTILSVISETLNINVERNGEQIILK